MKCLKITVLSCALIAFFASINVPNTLIFGLFAQDYIRQTENLIISPSDIRLEIATEGGWNLYIRKKPGMQSVLLSETTKDPLGLEDSYTYRTPIWNPINGNERRILNGEFLNSPSAQFSIIDSTPQADSQFGSAFQLYIPQTMIYGYPWSRNGEVIVSMGTFINIRSFEKPYADYTGSFADNPYMFDFNTPIVQLPPEPAIQPPIVKLPPETAIQLPIVELLPETAIQLPIVALLPETAIEPPIVALLPEPAIELPIVSLLPEPAIELPIVSLLPEPAIQPPAVSTPILTNSYNSRAANAFSEIASGMMIYSRGPETIVEDVMTSFRQLPINKPIDVVFVIDATGSMWDTINRLQTELVPKLTEQIENKDSLQLGLVFYRDFGDNFKFEGLPVQIHAFMDNKDVFFEKLTSISIPEKSTIGGDTPEAVYEALYAAMEYYPWRENAEHKIILIGDAEPHPTPRGAYGIKKEEVKKMATLKDISIDCIITPDGSSDKP